MKKALCSALIFLSSLLFAQISMIPANTHYNDPYQVTIQGNGTIYYTTDGSTPTLSSSSGTNAVQINIDQNKELKAFLVDGSGNTSSVLSRKYYTGTLPTATIYFKPPANWTNGSCVMTDMVNPNSVNGGVVDYFWPGRSMQNTGCSGWYKLTDYYENANIYFTNCTISQSYPGSESTNTIYAGSTIFYDFTNGVITNPPACLLSVSDINNPDKVILVKVYPNPVSDILKIKTEKNFQDYEIIDVSGKVLFKDRFSKEIPIQHLSAGNYFIKLKDSLNDFTLIKFIKK